MIQLIVEPRVVKTWEQFIKESPPYSIALDGYVSGAPKYQPEGPRLNLNHHEDVDRYSTLCTSMQAYLKLKLGLFEKFSVNGQPRANIYVNDPDQDSSLAAFILTKPEISLNIKNQKKLEELLHYEQIMDITGGMFPLDMKSKIMQQMAWIFEPYDSARISGKLYSMNGNEMKNLMQNIFSRIKAHLDGKSYEIALDNDYTILYGKPQDKFVLVKENSAYSRAKIIRDGIKSFASLVRENDGIYKYTLGKISDFIPLSLPKIYNYLNKFENIKPEDTDRWGGSQTIGGSPRKKQSKIAPEKLFKLITNYIKNSK
ncbi:hypothetical protein HYS72_02660 [Candidatus Pacearchaeota archaeon]|nr:hypothetical protein [Candidatus Pacearchaeota archaeon]MBI2057124.1 hypothetical protein [Candidatus Pacearchaeota archaeon]